MTRYRNLLLATTFATSLTAGGAFAPPNANNPSFVGGHCDRRGVAGVASNGALLRLSAKGGDCGDGFPSDKYSHAFAHNKARTSVRHLLTQRTVQSFLFLLQQCRDDHTASWIEKFGDVGGLLTFHGTGAFNLTRFPKWDTFFVDMIDEPKESIVLRVKSRSGVNGGGRRGGVNSYFDSIASAERGEGKCNPPSEEKKGSSPSTGSERAGFGGSYLDALSSSTPAKKTAPANEKRKAAPKFGAAGASYLDALLSEDSNSSKNKSLSAKKKKRDKARGEPVAGMSYLDALASEKPEKPSKKVYKPNKEDFAGERFVEINVDIDPSALVNRMIMVREHIADEWVKDLRTLVQANDLILDNYYNSVRAARELEEEQIKSREGEKEQSESEAKLDIDTTKGDTLDIKSKGKKKATSKGLDVVASKDGDGSDKDISNAAAGKSDTAKSSSSSSKREVQSFTYDGLSIFDTNAFQETSASPLRKSNFDLLCLLVTQEAVHRVLREYQIYGDEKEVPFAFLKQFYIDRIDDVFDGSGPYGRHDDFVQSLLMASPTIVTTEDGKVGLNDPQRIAKKIIHMRDTVANEWRDLMKDIPQQHLELRKALLGKQLEKSLFNEIKTVDEPKVAEVIEGGDFE